MGKIKNLEDGKYNYFCNQKLKLGQGRSQDSLSGDTSPPFSSPPFTCPLSFLPSPPSPYKPGPQLQLGVYKLPEWGLGLCPSRKSNLVHFGLKCFQVSLSHSHQDIFLASTVIVFLFFFARDSIFVSACYMILPLLSFLPSPPFTFPLSFPPVPRLQH